MEQNLFPTDKQNCLPLALVSGFAGGSVVKNPSANTGDLGSIPGLGRLPGVGNGNPFQYSYLQNPVDRGAWQATVHESRRVGHD